MARSTPSFGGRQRGQALTEFALVSVLLALLLTGAIEFGFLYGHKIELANAARAGARWAAANPTAWTNAAAPASNTIEGQALAAGGTAQLPNTDSNLKIDYFAVSGSTTTLCGSWSAAGNSFVSQGAYTQATCVVDGNLVRVTVTNTYTVATALIASVGGPGVTISASAAMVVVG